MNRPEKDIWLRSMGITRLFQTSAMRLAARFAIAYAVVLAFALAILYWTSANAITPQTKASLESDYSELMSLHDVGGIAAMLERLKRTVPVAKKEGLLFLLTLNGDKVAGTLHEWPHDSDLKLDGMLRGAWMEDEVLPGALFEDDAFLPTIAAELGQGYELLLTVAVLQTSKLHEVTEYLLEAVSAAILVGLIISMVVGTTMLRRLEAVRLTARAIMTGNLERRIAVSGRGDEFDELSVDLNMMLDRIQQLVNGVKEVTDNIAHDMRSPLTRMRNRLELILLEKRSQEEYVEALRSLSGETDSLIRTFNALLSIARAEAGHHRSEWLDIDLDILVTDLVELFRPTAEEKNQEMILVVGRDSVVAGSRDLLAQAIGNLIENAVKYSRDSGQVSCEVLPSKGHVTVLVSDSGPGIPEQEQERVLQRFVRLDGSRQTPGNGLGLSLVNAVATLYGARLTLNNTQFGFEVRLKIPRVKTGVVMD